MSCEGAEAMWNASMVVRSLEAVLKLLDDDRAADAALVVRAVIDELRASSPVSE